MADKSFTTHKINFKRTGECNRCPGVNPAPCCIDCPHFDVISGVNTCLIYNTRNQICKECSQKRGKDITHNVCIEFPNHAWLNILKSDNCGYTFEPLTKEDEDKFNNLTNIWQ